MNKMMIALAVLPLAACSNGVTFDLTSTMEAQTRGVGMFNGNDQGVAGMLDQTCAFDIAEGRVLGDIVDLPGTDDRVVDSDGIQALISSDGNIWNVSDWGEALAITTPGNVLDAGYTMDGVAALTNAGGTCSVFFGDWSEQSVELSGFDCINGRVETSPNSMFAFVADGATVARVDLERGVEVIEAGADLMAWDERAEVLVIASSQGSNVRGIDADGETQWTVEVDGIVDSIDTLGNERFTLVSFTGPSGDAEIVVLNSGSGDVHGSVDVPASVEITASPDGVIVALNEGDMVHFYDVTPSSSVLGTPSVQPQTSPAFSD